MASLGTAVLGGLLSFAFASVTNSFRLSAFLPPFLLSLLSIFFLFF